MKSRRVSKLQMEIIVETMEANKNLASNQVSKSYRVAQKAADWNLLALKLNQVGQAVKSTNKWQKCWADFKCEVKKKFAHNSKQVPEADGSIQLRQISALDKRVLTLIGINIKNNQSTPVITAATGSSVVNNVPDSLGNSTSFQIVDMIAVEPLSETLSIKTEDTTEYLNDEGLKTNATIATDSTVTNNLPESSQTSTSFHIIDSRSVETADAEPENITSVETPSMKVPKRVRKKSSVLNNENSSGLFAAEEDTAAAIRTVAAAIEKLAEAETRKAIAFEKLIQHFWG